MTADRIARAFVDRVRRDLMNGKPAWQAEMELRDLEIWAADHLIKPALEEEFDLGWRERGWFKEENDDDTTNKY